MSSSAATVESVDATIVVDRFVSASTVADVVSSLEQLWDALQAQHIPTETLLHLLVSDNDNEQNNFHATLLDVLASQHPHLPAVGDEGANLAARIYHHIITQQSQLRTEGLLLQPAPGRLMETLLDVATTHDESSSLYTRVLCLKSLAAVSREKQAQPQILAAPNGLHRFGLLLSTEEDVIRQQALETATIWAQWSAVAKIWMFDDVGARVLQGAAVTREKDPLVLVHKMLQHDTSLADLLWANQGVVAPAMARLLDLRLGQAFVNPSSVTPPLQTKKTPQKPMDDLDDLMGSKEKKTTTTTKVSETELPRLTPAEEDIIDQVFAILGLLLSNKQVQQDVWSKHTNGLVSLLWELALIAPPAPQQPPPCAYPSVSLQQRALITTATYFNDPTYVQTTRPDTLDRLLYTVCTGGQGESLTEKLSLSQSALHVIRQVVSSEMAHEMLLQSLAPVDDEATHAPHVVDKLLQTLSSSLRDTVTTDDRRVILVAGAVGGLSLFLTDEASRSMLLRLTTTNEGGLLSDVLGVLASPEDDDDKTTTGYTALKHDREITQLRVSLLRFLCQWVSQAPMVVHALLSLPTSSTILPSLLKGENDSVVTMGCLLLGLVMEYMGYDESLCGGWTRQTILELLSKRMGGIGRLTTRLERLKQNTEFPWSTCTEEWKVWSAWYNTSVLVVRKRLVQTLTGGKDGDDVDDNVPANSKALNEMLAQQTTELEELREKLSVAEKTVKRQERELDTWKVRVESTPTQLDSMLSEYSSKNAELETELSTLKDTIESLKEKHATDLTSKDDELTKLKSELTATKEQEAEARQELESTREEMTALSHAYTSLEEEYRLSKAANPSATQTPAGEAGEEVPRDQPEGEGSQQASGSTEVATLRAANSRLRNDNKAAEEWMAMAVQKMTELNNEKALVEQEVASLRGYIDEMQKGQQQHATQQTERDALLAEMETLRRDLTDEQTLRDSLENELASVRHQLEQSSATVQADLQRIENLSAELEESRRQQEIDKAASDAPTAVYQGSEDTAVLRANIETLQQDLQSAQAALESSREKDQQEIYQREARIRELESRLDGGLGGYTVADVNARDEEIAQLREANEAAQDWMSKAVESHQSLSNQVADLTHTNHQLGVQVKDLTSQLQGHREASEADNDFESKLKAREDEIKRLSEELAGKETQFSELNEVLETSQAAIEEKREEVATLHAQTAAMTEELQALHSEIENLREQQKTDSNPSVIAGEDLSVVVRNLESQLEEQERDSNEALMEWEKTYNSLADRYKELESQLQIQLEQNTAHEAAAKEQRMAVEAGLRTDLAMVSREKEELLEKLSDAARNDKKGEEIEDLRLQIENLTQQLRDSEADSAAADTEWQNAYNELEKKYNSLAGEGSDERGAQTDATRSNVDDSEALAVIEEWEKAYSDLESKFNALVELKESSGDASPSALEDKDATIADLNSRIDVLTQDLQDSEAEAAAVIEQWQASYADLESKLSATQEASGNAEPTYIAATSTNIDKSGSDSEIAGLKSELESSKADALRIAQEWQASYSGLEEKFNALEEENKLLKESQESPSEEQENEVVAGLRAQVENLTKQLDESESEAARVISEWQVSYAGLEERFNGLVEENQRLKESQESPPEEKIDDAVAELRAQVENLTKQLDESESEAARVISEWQESYAELEFRHRSLSENDGANDNANSSEVAELSSQMESLSQQLRQNEEEAANVIDEWQASYAKLEEELESTVRERDEIVQKSNSRITELSSRIEELHESEKSSSAVVEDLRTTCVSLEEHLAQSKERVEELVREVDHLTKDKHDIASDKSADIKRLEGALAEASSKLEDMTKQWQATEEDAAAAIEEWQKSFAEVEAKFDQAVKENARLQEATSRDDPEQNDLISHVTELEESLKLATEARGSLEREMANSKSTIGELQTEVGKLSTENDAYQKKLLGVESSLASAVESKASLQEIVNKLRADLDSQKEQMEADLAAHSQRNAALSLDAKEREQHVTSLNQENETLFNQLKSLEEQLSQAQEEVELSKQQIKEAEEKESDLRARIAALEEETEHQAEDAEGAIAQWESSYQSVVAERENLQVKLQETVVKSDSHQSSLQEELDSCRQELAEATEALLKSKKDHGGLLLESEQIIEQWKIRVNDLEKTQESLQSELKQQETEANDAIASWEARCAELEAMVGMTQEAPLQTRVDELSALLEEERRSVQSKTATILDLEKAASDLRSQVAGSSSTENSLKEAKDRIAELEESLKEAEGHFNSRLEAAISDRTRGLDSLETEKILESERFDSIQEELHAAVREKLVAEEERDFLKRRVAELVDELHDANDAMQLRVTNEVSDRAAELATEALRHQLEEMRVQAEADQRDCFAERQARVAAEREAEGLRADLGALLGVENSEENLADIQKLALEAKSNQQKGHIEEIESLKALLEEASEKLSSSRLAEKRSQERAAKADARASMYEQELVEAKSDLKFLTDSMDEMREAESTRRSSLEYRLASLENDNDVLRRFHGTETETLRNELNQISMERDRLFQALKESEKSKEALLRASSKDARGSTTTRDLETELEMLRLEKAELLSAAAEEGSRVERRLHEAVSAAISSAEADLIVEKELRLAAENALDNMKQEMTDVKSELSAPKTSHDPEDTAAETENEALKSQVAQLIDEKERLEERLTLWKIEADRKIAKLSEECRMAKSRAIHLEREGRYEAEIRAEVSRLQSKDSTGDENPAGVDPAEEDVAGEESAKVTKLSALIQQQKEAIDEERAVYFDLLSEHDDLLALLAQQDLLKSSLNSALARIGGEEAVEAAIREAEERAIAQYGKYVKLT